MPVESEHGKRSTFNKGCHCEKCRQANAEYKTDKVHDNKQLTAPYAGQECPTDNSAIPHGTETGYDYWGCRGNQCSQAKSDAEKARRELRAVKGLVS